MEATPKALFTQDRPQAEPLPAEPQTSATEEKVTEAVQLGAAVAAVAAPQFAPVIAAGVELEPEVYHFVSALIHLLKKKK